MIPLMLATLADRPFDDKDWVFEIKWDGCRAISYKTKKKVEIISRGNKSFNQRFAPIVQELNKFSESFVLDGEIVILNKKGVPDFQLLQNYQRTKVGTLRYYVFDILSFEGQCLTDLPFIERREILKKLLESQKLSRIKLSECIEEKGKEVFQFVVKKGLEGIVAKHKESTYQLRRSPDWLKIKTRQRQEVVIGGYTLPKGSRKCFGALVVGVYEKGDLVYVGHVGGGFNVQMLKDLYQELKKIKTSQCPFSIAPEPNKDITWVKPILVCEVIFAEWTQAGILRMPIFKGLRSDKEPKEVVRETMLKLNL